MSDTKKVKPAGIYYVLCCEVARRSQGANVFNFKDHGYFMALVIYSEKPEPDSSSQHKIARVRFLDDNKLDAHGRYEFLGWE